ncbi:ABC transporter ATP-binding protein [Kitasatospora sp. NPDC051853]|uniref:ABC transporter ATP-binding protein n=1 Tax=Kitasatospora sp. NPDC051853 TaxID=3364058 RepID=UPI00379AA026
MGTRKNPAGGTARRAVRPVAGRLALLAGARLAGAAVVLALPAAVAGAADAALAGRADGRTVAGVALLLLAAAGLEAVTEIVAASCGTRATALLRHGLLAGVLARGTAGRELAAGDVTGRLVANTTDAGHLALAGLGIVAGLATSLAGLVMLWFVHPWLAVTLVVSAVPLFVLIRLFVSRMADLFVRYQELQASIAARLTETLAGIRTVRAAGTLEQETARVLEPLPALSAVGTETWERQRSVVWRMQLLVPVVEAAVLTVAGFAVVRGTLPAGQLLAAAGYTVLALGFLNQIDAYAEFARARAGARRVDELLDGPSDTAPSGREPLAAGPGRVQLRKVTVRQGGRTVLDAVDLDLPAGRALALVGPSGAGKSTLARLIGRLAEADEGEVLLDGTPVDRVDPRELRQEIAYAFERPVLLGGTVRDAIAYGCARPEQAAVERAARLAEMDTFVRRLPQGYATPLAGLGLSGGETQRLGLARALARGARVLVLDDATSSLDTVTEMKVSRMLTEDLAGRTRLIIARRPATAAGADHVVWLDDGRVRAVGEHADLWSDPEYRAVFGREEAA